MLIREKKIDLSKLEMILIALLFSYTNAKQFLRFSMILVEFYGMVCLYSYLIRNDLKLQWISNCHATFEVLKSKLVQPQC
jgi:hypothetical protein